MNDIKREYIAPVVLKINLDNEISLQLESGPPVPGNEEISKVPEFFNKSPFNPANC